MSNPIVTRFAPSPTGFLHIGGARTALFNWLLARRHGGKMLLRIEDTDRVRSTPEAIEAIIDGMSWLGLRWDDEIVYQFARADRHREIAEQMLKIGAAYKCYATPAELDAMREQAKADGKPMRYDGRWRDRSAADQAAAEAAGLKYVIRLKAPLTGQTVVQDLVQGTVTWENENLDDLVLLRSDGTPTYMHAVVVDDHDMGVTHIIRGDDHLTNAARQTQIYQAMRWRVPIMAHIPLIHGADGAKLSKRHGALGVDAYRALGYLPEALRNYLVRLGWAHGDQEIFSTEEMAAVFDLKNVGRSPARFDFTKLESINGHYMRKAADADLLAATMHVLPHIDGGQDMIAALDDRLKAQWLAAMPGLKERAKTLVELIEGSSFLFAKRPIALDDKARDILAKDGKAILARLIPRLESAPVWEAAALEEVVRTEAEASGIKLGALAQPLRAALTGRSTSPGIFDVLVVMGREECLGRLKDQAG
ncbi:GlnS Glutamyl- and glutaminyl-tRNA synthetases [Rhabdaerophilaceae bacterium]